MKQCLIFIFIISLLVLSIQADIPNKKQIKKNCGCGKRPIGPGGICMPIPEYCRPKFFNNVCQKGTVYSCTKDQSGYRLCKCAKPEA